MRGAAKPAERGVGPPEEWHRRWMPDFTPVLAPGRTMSGKSGHRGGGQACNRCRTASLFPKGQPVPRPGRQSATGGRRGAKSAILPRTPAKAGAAAGGIDLDGGESREGWRVVGRTPGASGRRDPGASARCVGWRQAREDPTSGVSGFPVSPPGPRTPPRRQPSRRVAPQLSGDQSRHRLPAERKQDFRTPQTLRIRKSCYPSQSLHRRVTLPCSRLNAALPLSPSSNRGSSVRDQR